MTAAAVAVVAAARRRVVEKLREQGAFSQGTSAPLNLHRRIDRRVFDRLTRSGIVIQAGGGRYYLNLAALDAYDARVRSMESWVIGALGVGAVVGLLAALL